MKQVTLNTEELSKVYWEIVEEYEKRRKAADEDSKKHNGYIDRDHYKYLSRRANEKRQEQSEMYSFIQKFIVAPTVKLGRGKYSFSHEGVEYTVKKYEVEDSFGWKKGTVTQWKIEGDGKLARTGFDSKTQLLEMTNSKIQTEYITSLIGKKPKTNQDEK